MTEAAAGMSSAAAAELVARAALALDDEDFTGFLAWCTADFRYEVRTWSPELRKWMTWLAQSRSELEALLAALPEHLRRRGRLLRQLGPTIVDAAPDGATDILITDAFRWAFERDNYGYAAAYSTLIFIILLAFTAVTNRITGATKGAFE